MRATKTLSLLLSTLLLIFGQFGQLHCASSCSQTAVSSMTSAMPCCAAGQNAVLGSCCDCAEQSPLLTGYSGAIPDLGRVKEEPPLPAFALPKLRIEACANWKTYNRSLVAVVTGPDKLYLLHGSLLI